MNDRHSAQPAADPVPRGPPHNPARKTVGGPNPHPKDRRGLALFIGALNSTLFQNQEVTSVGIKHSRCAIQGRLGSQGRRQPEANHDEPDPGAGHRRRSADWQNQPVGTRDPRQRREDSRQGVLRQRPLSREGHEMSRSSCSTAEARRMARIIQEPGKPGKTSTEQRAYSPELFLASWFPAHPWPSLFSALLASWRFFQRRNWRCLT